ncbi:23S rRNA (uracil(1939)-C(5))-methyltransferase RlmD [Paenibacillus sp. SYP-B4298]|uniref:23S rRNA (uracil(1939)-C(5))-methyltransferase RlmD n=1 Tax=Paenibacillus sp. SYP-B4298 TaxID=2996034 RepID=UPI003FA7172C
MNERRPSSRIGRKSHTEPGMEKAKTSGTARVSGHAEDARGSAKQGSRRVESRGGKVAKPSKPAQSPRSTQERLQGRSDELRRTAKPSGEAPRQNAPTRKRSEWQGDSHHSKPRQPNGDPRPGRKMASAAAAAASAGGRPAEQLGVGDRIVVTIKRVGINGEGVGYYRRKTVFIDGAIAGEVVKAQVVAVEPSYVKAELLEIEKQSSYRQQPLCPVFDRCGGCQVQHIAYEGQLQAKEELVREAFRRYTGLNELPMKPIAGMEQPWGYRNKAQLQLQRVNGDIVAGLYEANSHALVDISDCSIQHPQVNEAVNTIKRIMDELRIPLYREHKGKDGIRTLVVRYGFQSDELQVTLVADGERIPRIDELVRKVHEALPQVIGIALNVNGKKTSLIFGEHTRTLWGRDTMKESLAALEFELSPRAFFQLNPVQTVKLYDSVRAAAALRGDELVVDAYCGTGTIGLWLAPYVKEVRGIELISEAVEDARRNAAHNGYENVQFYAGRAEELLPRWAAAGIRPDVIIADPPRTGLERQFIDTVLRVQPKRFVYVSCNPSTLAKDCKTLIDGGYTIEWVQPVDLFPMTSHVENVALLVRDGV